MNRPTTVFFLLSSLFLLSFAACGQEEPAQQCQVVDDPDEGVTTVYCPGGTTSEIPHAEDGTSCTVEDNDDGTSTISCDDGTEAVVEDGDDGAGCTVTEDDGEYTISCEDGTEGTVTDGEDGAGCTVEDNDDGSATVSCDDGTEVIIEDGAGCTVEDHGDGSATVNCDDGTDADIGCTAHTNDDDETVLSCGDEQLVVTSGDACSLHPLGDGEYELTCDDTTVTIAESGDHCTVDDNDDGSATITCPDGTETTVPLAIPELTVVDFDVDNDRNDITWEATIENEGLGDASSFWVDFFLDETQAPLPEENRFGDDQRRVESLGADEQITVEGRIKAVDNDTYESWLIADTLLGVSASDDDIVAGPETVTLDHQGPEVELAISGFDVTTDADGLHWEATIHNNGSEDAVEFDVSYFVHSDDPIGDGDVHDDPMQGDLVTVASLDAGDQIDVGGTLPEVRYNSPGNYDSWVYADVYGANDDQGSANNPLGPETVSLSEDIEQDYEADLKVRQFDVYGGVQEATFVAVISNESSSTSGTFYADIFFDEATQPTAWDFGDEYVPMAPLGPGETESIFVTYYRSAGTYEGWLRLDPGFTDELDTSNRVGGGELYTVDSLSGN